MVPVLLGAATLYMFLKWPQISKHLAHFATLLPKKGNIQCNVTFHTKGYPSSISGFRDTMTECEAKRILGLKHSNHTVLEVKHAHRELIGRNHLDMGGSEYLTYKINEARDILLGKSTFR